ERDPDLLVVTELRVAAQRLERPGARLGVPRRVELEPVAGAPAHVPVGPPLPPPAGQREGDGEQDPLELHPRTGPRYACGGRPASDGRRRRTSSIRARSSSAEITVGSSGASASTIPHGSTMSDRP